MEKVKVITARKDDTNKDGFVMAGGKCHTTNLDYKEEELTGHEIYEAINECVPVYTVNAIQNENTQIK